MTFHPASAKREVGNVAVSSDDIQRCEGTPEPDRKPWVLPLLHMANLFKNERLAVLCQAGANSPLFFKNQTVPKLSPADPVYLPFDVPDWSKLRDFPGYARAFDGLNNLGYIFVGKPRFLGEARQ